MVVELLFKTAHYELQHRQTDEMDRIQVTGTKTTPLIDKAHVYPLAYAMTFFSAPENKGKKGFPNEIGDWCGYHTTVCKGARTWLKGQGLLNNNDTATPELLELGNYVLPLIAERTGSTPGQKRA